MSLFWKNTSLSLVHELNVCVSKLVALPCIRARRAKNFRRNYYFYRRTPVTADMTASGVRFFERCVQSLSNFSLPLLQGEVAFSGENDGGDKSKDNALSADNPSPAVAGAPFTQGSL